MCQVGEHQHWLAHHCSLCVRCCGFPIGKADRLHICTCMFRSCVEWRSTNTCWHIFAPYAYPTPPGRDTMMVSHQTSRNQAVPVHPVDRHLPATAWRGKLFIDGSLPFRIRSAPKTRGLQRRHTPRTFRRTACRLN